jgi:hypothetical protein
VPEHAVHIARIVARAIIGSPLFVLLGEPRALAVSLSLIVLLPILDEAALALARSPSALALYDILHRFRGWRFVQLLYETLMRTRPVLALGVHRSRVSALSHVHILLRGIRRLGRSAFNSRASPFATAQLHEPQTNEK